MPFIICYAIVKSHQFSNNMGAMTRWRHRTRIYLNIFHLQATWDVAIWSSSSTNMSAIILLQDLRAHRNLLPDILSHAIAYILSIDLPRVELRPHHASALHAVPLRGAHRSQNNIKVTLRQQHQQQAPRHHVINIIKKIGIITKNGIMRTGNVENGIQTANGAIETKQLLKKNAFHININIKKIKMHRATTSATRTDHW